jgi:hypothetical protein
MSKTTMRAEDVPFAWISAFMDGASYGEGVLTVPMSMLREGLAAVAVVIAKAERDACIASVTKTTSDLEALTGSADNSWMLRTAVDAIRARGDAS